MGEEVGREKMVLSYARTNSKAWRPVASSSEMGRAMDCPMAAVASMSMLRTAWSSIGAIRDAPEETISLVP